MRKGIHPEYVESKFICSCGSVFTTRSTKPEVHLELCSQCHPFYTGKQKFVDTGGRVQRFADKFGDAAATAVIDRESAAKEERRKATEAAAVAAKEARDAKAAEKAAKASKYEGTPMEKPGREKAAEAAEEPVSEEPVAEAVEVEAVEESVAEAVEEPTVEAVEAAEEPAAEATEAEVESEAAGEESAE